MAAATIAATLALSASSAQALLFDGFGDSQGPATATAGAPSDSNGPMAITDTELPAPVTRTIEVTQTGGPGDVTGRVFGGAPGFYSHSQDTLTTGTSKVTWNWASAIDLSGLMAVVIDVLSVDLPGASLSFTLCSGAACSSDSFALPNVIGTYGWQIASFAGTADLTMIDSAMLMIDGSRVEDLDVAIDFVQVPEASVLGLFGLSLIGLGLAARRRELR